MKYAALLVGMWITTATMATPFSPTLLEAQWQVESSAVECRLSQSIAQFGEAAFIQESGEPLQLAFVTQLMPPVADSTLRYSLVPAQWHHQASSQELLVIPAATSLHETPLQGDRAMLAYIQLKQGFAPSLTYSARPQAQAVEVVLSGVGFVDASRAFETCLAQLPAESFRGLRETRVYFETNQSTLSSESIAILDRLARYVQLDDSIRAIQIDGHADNTGTLRINQPLSEARAAVVKNRLVSAGVDAQLLRVFAHADQRPAASNETVVGRALNRRTEIQLFRQQP